MRTYASDVAEAIDLHSGPTSSEATDAPNVRGWFVRATTPDHVTYVNVSPMPHRLGAEFIAADARRSPEGRTPTAEYDVVSNYGALGMPSVCVAEGHSYISTGGCRNCDLDLAEVAAYLAMEMAYGFDV